MRASLPLQARCKLFGPGLGTPQNLETAYAYFVTAASSNDPLGHNGLGYIYFRGTNAQVRLVRL